MPVATRDVTDFAPTGVEIINLRRAADDRT
jgi:hypothetical protein